MPPLRPFRSKNLDDILPEEKQTIPLIKRDEVRRTTLHHIHGPKSWMCDYFFLRPGGEVVNEDINKEEALDSLQAEFDGMPYTRYRGDLMMIVCCFIHCNSRYVVVEPLLSKNTADFRRIMSKFINPTNPEFSGVDREMLPIIDTLISDKEKSFCSAEMERFYAENRIVHKTFNMSANDSANRHLALAIIDRFARTLRDMIFNCQRNDASFRLSPNNLQQLVKIYNTTPHATLSKIMQFELTPADALKHLNVQNELVRRLMSQNFITTNHYEFDEVWRGDDVYLHKPKKFGEKRRSNVEDVPYRVAATKKGGFALRNRDGSILREDIQMISTAYRNDELHVGDFVRDDEVVCAQKDYYVLQKPSGEIYYLKKREISVGAPISRKLITIHNAWRIVPRSELAVQRS